MTYENKAFPHTSGTSYNHYGKRGLENGVVSGGALPSTGTEYEAVVYITGDDFAGATSFDTKAILPKGAIPIEGIFEVNEAFTLGNADNVFYIGTNGSESTNGVSIGDPDIAGVSEDTTVSGTWANPLAADTAIGVSVSGTSASVTGGSGRAKVVIRYRKL